jgi:hypothetical protein
LDEFVERPIEQLPTLDEDYFDLSSQVDYDPQLGTNLDSQK